MKTNNRIYYKSDKIAVFLARCIVCIQFRVAVLLNHWFNAYTARQKKIVLLLFGTFTFLFLAADTWRPFLSIPKISQDFNTAHIGQASDFPFSKLNKRQLTDSLTKKSQLWKQH